MLKRFIITAAILAFAYIAFLSFKMMMQERNFLKSESVQKTEEKPTHKIYSFTFTKYTSAGQRELEIEGDSADIFANVVNLTNVIAKAYAEESPVTITADSGVFDRSTSKINLKKNVVATTTTGARMLSPSLEIDPPAKTVATEEAVQVQKDNIDIDGVGAKGDSNLKNVKFHKKVTVVIQSDEAENPLGIAEGEKKKSRDPAAKKNPTVITCDGPLDIDYENNIAYFYNNVVVVDKRGKLSADKMDVYYNKNRKGVQKIVAVGNVVIENPDGNTTYSDNVIYLAEEGRVILGGDPEAAYLPNSKFAKEFTPPTGRKETQHVAA